MSMFHNLRPATPRTTRLLRLLAAFFAVVVAVAMPARDAAAEECVQVSGNVVKGKFFHGMKCLYSEGCKCIATKCTGISTLYGTNHKSPYTKYKNPLCVAGAPECKPISKTVLYSKTYYGVKCNESGGCFCSAQICGGVFKNVSCTKIPT